MLVMVLNSARLFCFGSGCACDLIAEAFCSLGPGLIVVSFRCLNYRLDGISTIILFSYPILIYFSICFYFSKHDHHYEYSN
jgi:hypothetical protein